MIAMSDTIIPREIRRYDIGEDQLTTFVRRAEERNVEVMHILPLSLRDDNLHSRAEYTVIVREDLYEPYYHSGRVYEENLPTW